MSGQDTKNKRIEESKMIGSRTLYLAIPSIIFIGGSAFIHQGCKLKFPFRCDDSECAKGAYCHQDVCIDATCNDDSGCLGGRKCFNSKCGFRAPETFVVNFNDGEHTGTMSGPEATLQLAMNKTRGTYRSIVFRRGATPLTELNWVPEAPYSKPLPHMRRSESGYARDAVSMDENVVLYDFEEAPTTDNRRIGDWSGRGNVGNIVGTLPAVVPAPVGFGYAFGSNNADHSYLRTSLSSSSDLQLEISDYTWQAWVRTNQPSETTTATHNNRVFFGMEESGSHNPHIWFGLSRPCNGDAPGAAMGGTFRSSAGTDSASYCGTSAVNDGKWHMVTMAKSGHALATVAVYVDGEHEQDNQVNFAGPIEFTQTEQMHYGAFVDGTYPSTVDMSQIQIYRRALSPNDIRAMYRRSALRLSIQMRQCGMSDCSDALPFVGPDQSSNTSFRDQVDNLSPPVSHPVNVTGDYVQLQVTLESDTPGETPVLRSLTLNP